MDKVAESPVISNRAAAELLFDVATILELADDTPVRVRAYRRAARLLLQSPDGDIPLDENGELILPGIGPRLRSKLRELLKTGRMGFYVEMTVEEPLSMQHNVTESHTLEGADPDSVRQNVGKSDTSAVPGCP